LSEVEQELIAYWSGGERFLYLTDKTLETHRIVKLDFAETMRRAAKKNVYFVAPMPERIPDGLQIGLVVDVSRSQLIDFLNDPAKALSENASWKESCTLLARILSQRDRTKKPITLFVLAKCATTKGDTWLGGYF